MAKKKNKIDLDDHLTDNLLSQQDAVKAEDIPPTHNGNEEPSDKAEAEIQADELSLTKLALAELNDKYLRLYSEFDNYRKRTVRERAEVLKTATSSLITQLLPVLDDFDRANHSFENTHEIDALREGTMLIHAKFRKTLEQKGLEKIHCIGEPFNTDLHEAVANIPAESEEMKGKVVDEIEKGYTLNGTVIRFAKVAVAV